MRVRWPGRVTSSAGLAGLLFVAASALAQAPAPTSVPDLLSADTTFFVEGLDVDPRDGTVYVTSVHHRNVFRRNADGLLHPVLPPGRDDIGAVLGVRVDTLRDWLWLTTARSVHMRDAADSLTVRAALVAVRLADGAPVANYVLGNGLGSAGDLAITPSGELLVSDGLQGNLYRLRAVGGSLERVVTAGLRSPQGIAVDDNGQEAWVADWSQGLFHWDLRDNVVVPVKTADGKSVRGVDGLVRAADGRLIGVLNAAKQPLVVAVTLSPDGLQILDAQPLEYLPEGEGEPTVGVLRDGQFVFVATSAWRSWTEAGLRREPRVALPPVVLRWLPLERGLGGASSGDADHSVRPPVGPRDQRE